MKLRKVLSVTLAAALACSLSCVGVFAAESSEQSATVKGVVEEKTSEPDYSVTIPDAIDLGTIAADADTTQSYDVTVIAAELAGGSVSVTGEDAGTIANGESTIAFSNSFGTQTVSEETDESGTTLSGEITVAAEDAADAEAGDYSGTTVFTISYNAADADEAVVAKYEATFACEGVYSESYGGYTTLLNAVGSMIANYMVSPVTVTQYSNGSCDIAIECTSDKVFYLQVLEQVEDASSWQVGADGLYIGSEAYGMYNEVSDKNEQDDGVFTITLSELPEKLYMETNVGGAMEGTFDYIVCSMTIGEEATD